MSSCTWSFTTTTFFINNNNDQEKLTFKIFITTALRMAALFHMRNLMRPFKELLVVDILLDLISSQ